MKNHQYRYVRACVPALFSILLCVAPRFAAPAASTQVSPQLPEPMSWAGTRELAADSVTAAQLAVNGDVPVSAVDTLLRLFKLGVINARLDNLDAAVAAFGTVSRRSTVLAPLAMEQAGDIHAAGGDGVKAMGAYAAALGASGLPVKYRQHLFGKVRALVNSGTPLAANQPWLDEYRAWARRQQLFNAAVLESVCDSLAGAGKLAEADSLLEQHLSGLSRRDACGIVDRMFRRRSADSTAMGTKFLFSLASQANNCRNFELAERILGAVRKRRDFSTAVTAKQALMLEAKIAYSASQWKKAIDLYTKYNTEHGPDSEAITNIARAYRNLNNHEQSRRWYDLHVRHFPSHSQTHEILWLRAWNTEEARDYRAAAAAYRRVFETKGRRTEEAHVRHALCYYRMGQYDSAIVHLASFQRKFPQSSYLWSGMFWQGKSHAAAGREEEARKIWSGIIKLDPTDYHAHRARQLMGITMIDAASVPEDKAPVWVEMNSLPRRLDAQMSDAEARAWLDRVSPSTRRSLTAKDSVDIRRGGTLLAVARSDLAEFFLDDYERNYSANLRLQYEMAAAYAISGDYARAFRVSRRLAWRIPMERRERIPLQVLTVIYPPFYSSTITPNAERFNVDPLFVSAVMRQESIFDKNIVSPAGAVGLMQIMPATGANIAKELKEQFTVDSLYSYAYNIRFGTYYLRKRLTQFGGDHVLALCSYNAGPNNAAKWRDRNRGKEYDLFAEDIGFFETRGYVKKVMGNYWTYRILADTPGYEYELPFGRELYPWVNDW